MTASLTRFEVRQPRPEGAKTYQPRARLRELHERCRRPGFRFRRVWSPERAEQNCRLGCFALSGLRLR